MFKILFGCDGSTAVTTEAPQWRHRQRGRITDKANGLLPARATVTLSLPKKSTLFCAEN
jgi:hypothetical protein